MHNWANVAYPCPSGFPTPSFGNLAASVARTAADLTQSMNGGDVRLDSVGPKPAPLGDTDMPLIVLTRNDMRLIEAFLAHYRGLGVTRFIIVDDGSSDGTRELLAAQPDVDLHISNKRYGEAYRGRLWRQVLVRRYGLGRWYLNVDSDEFLVFSAAEDLRSLTSLLDRRRIRHLAAPMLDMYPAGRVQAAHYVYARDGMPWNVAGLFDQAGYRLAADVRSWGLKGGVRQRVFGSNAQLMKYPLMHWGQLTGMDKSVHFPNPYWNNFSPPMGALLHFKFFADFSTDFAEVVRNGQHFGGAQVYRKILDEIADTEHLMLQNSCSIAFQGVADLAKRGYFAN